MLEHVLDHNSSTHDELKQLYNESLFGAITTLDPGFNRQRTPQHTTELKCEY